MRISISIQDFLRKINSLILSVVPFRNIVFFALFSAFFLLFTLVTLFVSFKDRHTFIVTHHPVLKEEDALSFPYVASKTGKKYYTTSCSFAKKIKEKNKVYFATETEALLSGREKSVVCE